jgi:hypothetical protein
MRAGEALGLDIRSIYEDFRTLEIVQKAKRGELRDHMKTKNADSRHGRVVDLSEPLAAMLRDFVGRRTGGLVFCKPDGSQLMQRDILKHSLHPILKKLGLEQGGFSIFRRFRITELETAEVPAALQHHLVGAREVARVRGVQKTPEAARMALAMGRKSRNRVHAAMPPEGSGGRSKWQVWQDFGIPKSRLSCLKSGGREGIRTPGLLVANEALSQLSYSPTSSREILANVGEGSHLGR